MATASVMARRPAFVIPTRSSRQRFRTSISADSSEAEERLRELPAIWDELKNTEKDIIIQETIKETDETVVTIKLLEEMLETALYYVQTKEQVEEEHAIQAHQAIEKAVDQEKVLEEFAKKAYQDADGLERREMAVADLAHNFVDNDIEERVHNYVEERLRAAKIQEALATVEEEEAVQNLKELKLTEEEFKATLEELKKSDTNAEQKQT
jgi:hypothetical protein